MPYIVTTKRTVIDQPIAKVSQVLSRRAVATLEEARDRAHGEVDVWRRKNLGLLRTEGMAAAYSSAALSLPESGGTVGPLPDGTVIEVERVTFNRLRDNAGWNPAPEDEDYSAAHRHAAAVIDAFNAQQGAHS